MSTTSPAITKALTAIDEAHSLDPKKITIDNTPIPYELHYAQRCTHWLHKRSPAASPALTLAIRAQHFRRWEVPRSTYPMTRTGYLTWRTFLKRRQASLVEELCAEAGIDKETCARVGHLIRKEKLASDEETQVLEDVACLVFLEDQFEQFEQELADEDKIVAILRKSWGKMTEEGHALAQEIPMEGRPREVLMKALNGDGEGEKKEGAAG